MEVQLVIKAPNQNIDDHIVHCNMEWTVVQLKNYLSISYPNQPPLEDQKLIYSGHLLSDHLCLKDILRVEEGQPQIYTFHLVCKNSLSSNQNFHASQQSNSQLAGLHNVTAAQTPENVLRHRNRPFPSTNLVFPQINPEFAQPSAVPAFPPDAQLAAQMAAMQQMYNYYFTQYMQSAAPVAVNAAAPPSPPPAGQQQQEQQALRADPEEEGVGRDWLDQAFTGARFAMVFFVLYLYSSPERMMLVIACVLVAFLYHEGWFARRRRPLPQGQPDETDRNRNEELTDEHELQAAMDGDYPPHARPPSPAFSPLTFLATFFTSLFPEPPPHVNVN